MVIIVCLLQYTSLKLMPRFGNLSVTGSLVRNSVANMNAEGLNVNAEDLNVNAEGLNKLWYNL